MTKKSFLQGAAILGIAGILVKILGAFYRIPLGNMIGDEGLGYYQTSYNLYLLLYSISTAGLPVAIAKLVSEKRALEDYRGAQKVFKISFIGLIIGGALSSLVILFGSRSIVDKIGNSNAYYSMIALAPALFFVPIMSAFRGYFQGRQNMTPTAISQVIEQLIRVIVGLFITYQLLSKGLAVAAGGASFGASLGAIIGTITMVTIYLFKRSSIKKELSKGISHATENTSVIIKRIIAIAIPITIGASIVPLLNTIDVAIVMRRLQSIGFSEIQANKLYGQLSGMAQTFINFPQVFSVALVMSLVPAISAVYAKKDYSQVRRISSLGTRVTILIGFPSAFGLYILATPIMELLYFTRPVEVQQSAGSILQILAFSVIFLTLVQCFTAILQGIGKPIIPVRNLIIGALFKLILTYILTGIPGIGIKGAAISTICAYAIAALLNFIDVERYTKTKFKLNDIFLKPFISSILMTLAVWFTYKYTQTNLGGKVSTVLAIFIGIMVYGLALLVTGSIKSEDFDLFPRGAKIAKALKSIGLLRS